MQCPPPPPLVARADLCGILVYYRVSDIGSCPEHMTESQIVYACAMFYSLVPRLPLFSTLVFFLQVKKAERGLETRLIMYGIDIVLMLSKQHEGREFQIHSTMCTIFTKIILCS